MSGRINPREYDLGELRDAVRETSRRDKVPIEADDRLAMRERSEGPVDGPKALGSQRHEFGDEISAVEDPEAYIRSRQRRRDATASSRSNGQRTGGTRTVRGHGRGRGRTDRKSRLEEFNSSFGRTAHRSGGDASRPYLESLPQMYGAQLVIFEWLERLISKAGRRGTISALEYYESIEWLSEESRAELEDFVDGIETTETADGSLGISDHRESLRYITSLADRHPR